jgi:hypothetical protein
VQFRQMTSLGSMELPSTFIHFLRNGHSFSQCPNRNGRVRCSMMSMIQECTSEAAGKVRYGLQMWHRWHLPVVVVYYYIVSNF